MNGKIWQKVFNEGQETEEMGKKCVYVTDIYKMHGSFQTSGIKRPQSLNLSNRLTHVRNRCERERKKKFFKKEKSPASFASTVLTFIQGLDFGRTFTLARAWQLHPGRHQGSALCVRLHDWSLYQQISRFPDDKGAILFQNNKSILFLLCALKLYNTYRHLWQAASKWNGCEDPHKPYGSNKTAWSHNSSFV